MPPSVELGPADVHKFYNVRHARFTLMSKPELINVSAQNQR
jgi:hypothetical protein